MRSRLPMHYYAVWGVFALGMVAVCLGVGGDDPSRISLTGTVTLDGRPLKRGTIQFYMTTSAQQVYQDIGVIEDGNYVIRNSGRLIPGTYEVEIFSDFQIYQPFSLKQRLAEFPLDDQVVVSPRYNYRSVLQVKVSHGGPSKFDFDLKN
ncbi:MAG: hypothetical protein ACP5XB_18495 [Isosphaeraceae bacterium]